MEVHAADAESATDAADIAADALARDLAAPPAATADTDPVVARLVDALGPVLEEVVTSSANGMRSVLKVKPFRRLWIALALSSLGDWLGLLAQTALAAQLGARSGGQQDAAFAIGGVLLVRLLPAVLLGPFAGAVADRFDRRLLMVSADVGRAALFVSIPLVGGLFWLNTATFLAELLALFWLPAKEASVPNLLRREQLEPANTLSLITTYGTAPVAAGVFALLASLSRGLGSFADFFTSNPLDLAMYFNALSFAVGAATVLGIREIGGRCEQRSREGRPVLGALVADVAEGWRFIGTQPLVRGLTLGIVGAFAAVGTVAACGRLYVGNLGGGDAAYGLFFGAVFLGLAAGMAGARVMLPGFPRRRLFGISIGAAGGSLTIVSVLPNLVVALAGVIIVGFWAGLAWVTGYTLLGGEVADEIRARTFAIVATLVRVTLFGVLALAPFLVGLIGYHAFTLPNHAIVRADGATIVMLVGGLLGLVSGAVSLRQMDDRRGVPLWRDVLGALRHRRPQPISHQGLFLSVEGGEGAGKSTQVLLLAEWLRGAGHEVVLTREPGATAAGARIRSLLLDPSVQVAPQAELLLYAADRAQHVAEVVLPALRRGAVVISDRFADSTRAYQGGGRGIEVEPLVGAATGGLEPELVVLLDVHPTLGLSRAAGRGVGVDRIEAESLAFHRRVRMAFLELARSDPRRWVVVGAQDPAEEVAHRVRAELIRRLGAERLVHAEASTGPGGGDRAVRG
jgi:dTMP kinase